MKKSKLGYKRYSPDVRKPYNVIPSGRITMQDVDFPVYGIDDMGNAQMMYPGGEYQFPGNQVFELPMAQSGMPVPEPYLPSNFFTPRQIQEARFNAARRFATPATGRIEGEGVIDVLLPIAAKPIAKAIAKPLMTIVDDAASYATTQTPLRNAWRLNPKAYQYNLPENTMWRGIGQEGMDDAVSSGVFRSKQNVPVEYFPGSTLRTSKSFGTNPYFTPKFKTAADYGDNFIAEVPIGAANWRNRYTNKPWSQIADKQIPIDEGKILQKDWLQGYKEIPKQLPGSPNAASSVDDVFNSKLESLINRESPLLTRNFNAAEFTDDMRGLRMENRILDNDFYQARNTKHFSGSGAGAAIGGGDYNTTFVGNIDDLRKNAHLRDVSPTDTYFYNPGDKFNLPDEGVFITSDPKVYKKLTNAGKTVKLDANLFSDAGNANLEKYITKDRGDILKSFDNYLANPDNRGSLIPSLYPNKKEAFASSWNSSAAHSYDILNTLESPASLLSNFRDPIIKEQWAKLPASAQQFELKKLNDYYKNNVLTGKISKDNLLNYDLKTYQKQYKKILEDLAEQSTSSVDDMGNANMMYGGEYQFPGNQVFELPMAQVGTGVPQPYLPSNFFTPEQIRQARIDAAKKAPLTFEGRINEALGNPKERAADLSQKVAPKGEGPVDNIRHTVAGMYTADAIANKLSPYAIGPTAVVPKIAGFMGSNLAGLAHEVNAFIPSLEGDYRNIPATARMSAEDMINNFVGSALSLNPFMNEKEKEDLIVKMSYENYLPDGYAQIHPKHSKDLYFKKEYGGDLEEFGSGGLKQWFAEKWVDVKTGKECGRSGKDKDGRPYPACRPSRRINSTTPKTTSEMSSSEKARFKREKTSGQRISYNHNRRQPGGQISGSLGYDSMYGSPTAAFRYMMNPKDESKYYGEVYGTKQGPGIAAGLDYDNQRYGTQGMIRLGADPLRGASIRAQAGKRFNPIDNRTEDLSWGPYGGVNFQTNDYTEFTGTGNQLGYNNLRPRLTAGANAQYNRELANRGRFSIEGDLGVGIGNRYGDMGQFKPEPYGAVRATYSPPMYRNTRNRRPSPTTYSPRGYQLGGQMTPQGITPAFFTGMKDAAVDAFKSFISSSDQPAQPAPVDWRKMDRPGQINYGIQETIQFDAPENRKTVENLLESTAYMENKYGQDPRAYGRNYTNSFMSIDPIALKDLFTGRGQNGTYTSAQKRYLETMKSMGLPTDQKAFTELLQQDDPRAAMVAARARYILSPQALPDMNNPREMFEYWLKNYNGMGVLKHQSRNKAYQDFLKGYKMALAND